MLYVDLVSSFIIAFVFVLTPRPILHLLRLSHLLLWLFSRVLVNKIKPWLLMTSDKMTYDVIEWNLAFLSGLVCRVKETFSGVTKETRAWCRYFRSRFRPTSSGTYFYNIKVLWKFLADLGDQEVSYFVLLLDVRRTQALTNGYQAPIRWTLTPLPVFLAVYNDFSWRLSFKYFNWLIVCNKWKSRTGRI